MTRMDRYDRMTVDTRTSLQERRVRGDDRSLVATPAPTIGAGAMVMFMLAVLILAMLAVWTIAQTGQPGLVTWLGDLFHTNAAQFCRANTC